MGARAALSVCTDLRAIASMQEAIPFLPAPGCPRAGMAARAAVSVCTDLRTIQWASQEIEIYGQVMTYPEPQVTGEKLEHIPAVESKVIEIYGRVISFSEPEVTG